MSINPLFFQPNRVWRSYKGGKILDKIEGKENPQDSNFPEDWIGSTTRAVNPDRDQYINEGVSVLTTGELLTDIIRTNGKEIFGQDHIEKYGNNTQFLTKFLDAADRLHFQVHPTSGFSKQHLNSSNGKTEVYYILDIREEVSEPYIYLGFQHPPDRQSLSRMIENQDIEELKKCFEKIEVRKGDVFIVPGGLPHAIGEGVFMIEIMEPTDFVARIEFERGGYKLPYNSRFMGRDLDFALDMFNYNAISKEYIKENFYGSDILITETSGGTEKQIIGQNHTDKFSVNKLEINGTYHDESDDIFYIGIVVKGEGQLVCPEKTFPLQQYSRFLIPCSLSEVRYEGKYLEILKIFPPK